MAILKALKDSSNFSASADYCEAKLAAEKEKDKCVMSMGYNCDIETIREETERTREIFNKKTGRQAKHYIISFEENELPQTEQGYSDCLEIGWLFAKENFPNHEVGVFVHGNTDNVHCHILVHTVDIQTGKKLQMGKYDLDRLKKSANEICKEYGCSIRTERSQENEYSNQVSSHDKEKSWTERLKEKVDHARKNALNFTQFEKQLNENGVVLERKTYTNHKTNEVQNYILFRDLTEEKATGKERKIKNTTLGKRFNESELEKQFAKNRAKMQIQSLNRNEVKSNDYSSPVNINIPTDSDEIKDILNDKKELIFEETKEKLNSAKSQEEREHVLKEEKERKLFLEREKQIQLDKEQQFKAIIYSLQKTFPAISSKSINSTPKGIEFFFGGATKRLFKVSYDKSKYDITIAKKDKNGDYEVISSNHLDTTENIQQSEKELAKLAKQNEIQRQQVIQRHSER